MSKDHTMKYLVEKLKEAKIINAETLGGGKLAVFYWIKSGKLKLRQRPYSRWYVVNDEEIAQIVKEFGIGGKGYWYYS